jgi:3-hydroxyacyl-CoA dehydrogenase/3-hydroxy-2-methylbutyryl-CoA dehydrogenase
MISGIPFPKRLGAPSEFASLVVSIVENSMVNGSTVRIDAGWHMA